MLNIFKTFTLLAPLAPLALGLQPTARWGHQAIYVPSEQAMYVVGGQVMTPGTQITNEVLILPLNTTNPQYFSGSSTNLPPHAFAGATLSHDGKSLMVVGGLSGDCDADSLVHTYTVTGSPGGGTWSNQSPSGLVRRRGAGVGTVNDGSAGGSVMVIGGISDAYTCCGFDISWSEMATSTNVYTAYDLLSVPLSSAKAQSSSNLPSDLTGSSLAVADFAFTESADHKTLYILGGQTASGALAPMDHIGIYTAGSGWTSKQLGGTVPLGRIGATLSAHPSLDLLILHGGARDDRGSDLSTTLLAFINTTTWQYTIPSHLQPPSISAVSFHSNVMTDSGVMVSTFGMDATGAPSGNTYYLDMRDPTQSTWSWKSVWNTDMLNTYQTAVEPVVNAAMGGGMDRSKKLASILTPVLFLLVAVPLAIWLIRRQVRINRKRRQARYFSFSSAEDEGEFRGSHSAAPGGHRGSIMDRMPWNKRRDSAASAVDGNEKDTTWAQDIVSGASALMARITGRSDVDADADHGREGRTKRSFRMTRGEKSAAMNWEEIDFGLGRVDANRRGSQPAVRFSDEEKAGQRQSSRNSSFSATGSPPAHHGPAPLAMANGITYQPTIHVYHPEDEQSALPYAQTQSADPFADAYTVNPSVIPSLTIQPPTAHPTPATEPTESFPVPQPLINLSPDVSSPSTPPKRQSITLSDEEAQAQALDWSALEQSLSSRPAFRSISPTSQLRSHQPGHQLPERRSSVAIVETGTSSFTPALPPLNFGGVRRSVSSARPQSMIVTPVTKQTPRSVSSPVSPPAASAAGPAGRQLAGSSIRRHSAVQETDSPAVSLASPISSGYGSPTISTAVRFDARSMPTAMGARRGSGTGTGLALGEMGQGIGLGHGQATPMAKSASMGSISRVAARPISALRIANPSDSDSEAE